MTVEHRDDGETDRTGEDREDRPAAHPLVIARIGHARKERVVLSRKNGQMGRFLGPDLERHQASYLCTRS